MGSYFKKKYFFGQIRFWKYSKVNTTQNQSFSLFLKIQFLEISESLVKGVQTATPDYFGSWLSVRFFLKFIHFSCAECSEAFFNYPTKQCVFQKSHKWSNFNIVLSDFYSFPFAMRIQNEFFHKGFKILFFMTLQFNKIFFNDHFPFFRSISSSSFLFSSLQ